MTVKRACFLRREYEPNKATRINDVVLDDEPLQVALLIGVEGLICSARRRKLCGPTDRRDFARRQDRTARQRLLEATVRVPKHVGLLIEHATIISRDRAPSIQVDVRLACEYRARRGVRASS